MRRISTALVLLMLANALASYLREMMVAALFGASAATDAYFSAYTLVTTASDLILGAALLTSGVPVVAPLAQAGEATLRERAQLVVSTATAIAAAGAILALFLWGAAPVLVGLIAPGLGAATRETASDMAGMMAWLVPVNGLLALFLAVLNAHQRFVAAALAGPAINSVFLLALLALSPGLGPFALPIAALLGPAATVVALALYLYRLGLLRPARLGFDTPAFRLLWSLARPTLLTLGLGTSAGLLTVSHLLLRSYASHRGEGAISALAYAFRIYEVPITLVANTAAAILLPIIAGLHARGEDERVAELCRSALVWGTLLLLPAVVVAATSPDLLVHVLFGYGRLTAAEAALTAEALRGFAPAILLEAVCFFLFQVFYALRRPRVPLALSLASVAITLALLSATQGFYGLTIVSACLSASFGVACVAGGMGILRFIGRRALPEASRLLGLAAATAAAFVVWDALAHASGDLSDRAALMRVVAVLAAYAAAALILLPGERKLLGALLGRSTRPMA